MRSLSAIRWPARFELSSTINAILSVCDSPGTKSPLKTLPSLITNMLATLLTTLFLAFTGCMFKLTTFVASILMLKFNSCLQDMLQPYHEGKQTRQSRQWSHAQHDR